MNRSSAESLVRRWPVWLAVSLCIVLTTLSLIASSPAPARADDARDPRFGLVFITGAELPDPVNPLDFSVRYSRAQSAGAKTNRFPFYWDKIETSNGSYNFTEHDRVVNADLANGFEINGILLGTPSWAAAAGYRLSARAEVGLRSPHPLRAQGLTAFAVPPRQLDLPWDDPNNYWGRFVYNTVSHFRGRVHYWEVWNEADMDFFWQGSVDDYYKLLKIAYHAIKAADPNAVVMMGGLAYWEDQSFFPALLDRVASDPEAAAHNQYFEVLPWHWYSRPSQLYDFTIWSRAQMQNKGFTKEIWVNETGVPAWDSPPGGGSPYAFSANMDEQASYFIQAFAYGYAAGVNRVLGFQLYDDGHDQAYGLIRNNNEPRPAYTAYSLSAQLMRGFTAVNRYRSGDIERVVFTGGDSGRVSVVWNVASNAQTVRVPSAASSARLIDKYGNESRIYPADGSYTVTLPGATCNNWQPGDYYIGGSPYFIVEPEQASGSITGSVRDNRGRLIGRAGVRLVDNTAVAAVSGLSGAYTLPNLAPGPYSLTATFSGIALPYPITGVDVQAGAATRNVNIWIPPTGDLITNGQFERTDTNGWTLSGGPTAALSTGVKHSGERSLRLGYDPNYGGDAGGDTAVAQSVYVPGTLYHPTLSFLYRMQTKDWLQNDHLTVLVNGNARLTVGYPTVSVDYHDLGWQQGFLDLTEYQGQTVELKFSLTQNGGLPTQMFLDEVTLGASFGGDEQLFVPSVN